jgi:hypothetical protein
MGIEQFGTTIAYTQYNQASVAHIVQRGELITPTDFVNLTVRFNDGNGQPINTDSLPLVSLVSPTGLVILTPTSQGVGQIGTGQYNYIFQAPLDGPLGIWNDVWQATINGFPVQNTFSFAIIQSQTPSINTDGFLHLGDDFPFEYSQAAIYNINKCLKMVKARLNSAGKAKSADSYGNVTYVDCDIFSVDMLVTFLGMSLSEFNTTPYFTNFTFDDSHFFAQFSEIIASGAVVRALASQALIEKGRAFSISDAGINFTPPDVSEILESQYTVDLQHHWEAIKMIKASMRPGPLGLGIFSIANGVNPAYRRLTQMRARRVV